MIDKDDKTLSVVRQCALLKVARSSLYYHPSRNNNDDLTLDGAERSAIPGDAVLRVAQDDGVAASAGACGQPQAGPPSDAGDGPDADLPETADQPAASRPPDLRVFKLPVPIAHSRNR